MIEKSLRIGLVTNLYIVLEELKTNDELPLNVFAEVIDARQFQFCPVNQLNGYAQHDNYDAVVLESTQQSFNVIVDGLMSLHWDKFYFQVVFK